MKARLLALLARLRGSRQLPGGAFLIHPDDAADLLAALDDGAEYRDDYYVHCLDCAIDRPCEDHESDVALARRYDTLYARLAGQRR